MVRLVLLSNLLVKKFIDYERSTKVGMDCTPRTINRYEVSTDSNVMIDNLAFQSTTHFATIKARQLRMRGNMD